MMIAQKVVSAKEARESFRARGISITDWCRDQGLDRADVYALLNGKSKGTRGKAHVAAVKLGLKESPGEEEM
jgi:gp16 family phage-associated protein